MESDSTNHQYILIRSTQPENIYGAFLQELLVSEGFMGFEIIDIDTVPMPRFTKRDIIVVTRCYLRDAEFALIKDAVTQGASAVIIQPQNRFVTQSGWKAENLVFHPGYIKIDGNYPGAGMPIQTHLPIPLYSETENAKDWKIVARALDTSWSGKKEYPAVVSSKYGSGKLVFLFYDLPQAVARIRFGNPELAGYCTVGVPWPHAFDLFAGHIDERLKHVPQADFHCQMLAKILTEVSPYPLPRFWYYEKVEHATACIIQSDDDYSNPEEFEDLAGAVEKRGGTISFYLMEKTKLSMEQVNSLVARGHTIAPHVNAADAVNRGTPGRDDLYFTFPEQLADETKRFDEKYGHHGSTLQPHFTPWTNYMELVPLHIENGYRLLFAYMCIFPCNDWIGNIEKQAENWGNYLCGSGRPIKFFNQHGKLHDGYQQPLIFFDDLSHKDFFALQARAVQVFSSKLEESATRTHSALSILSHPVSFTGYSKPVWEAVLDILYNGKHPIYNGDKWLDFLDRRAAVNISQEITDSGTLLLKIKNLNGLLPLMIPSNEIQKIRVNGQFAETIRKTRLNEIYECIQLDSLRHGKDAEIEIIKSNSMEQA